MSFVLYTFKYLYFLGGVLKMFSHVIYEFGKSCIKCGCLRKKRGGLRERVNSQNVFS